MSVRRQNPLDAIFFRLLFSTEKTCRYKQMLKNGADFISTVAMEYTTRVSNQTIHNNCNTFFRHGFMCVWVFNKRIMKNYELFNYSQSAFVKNAFILIELPTWLPHTIESLHHDSIFNVDYYSYICISFVHDIKL